MVALLSFCFSEHDFYLRCDMNCPTGPTVLTGIILTRACECSHSPHFAGEETEAMRKEG